jgi:uncharacterized protein (TIGR00730 family)
MKRVCIFCASRAGARRVYLEAAQAMARALLRRGVGLVYGGGCNGLMGELADTMLANGGEVIGVIPRALVAREVAHRGVTELLIVRSMHDRKARMSELAEGFIALPGGFGTLEEFCEILTWAQLGLHQKPCAILNIEGYYDPLLALFDRAVGEEFLHPINRRLVLHAGDPESLLDIMFSYEAPFVEKWIDSEES